MLRYLLQSGMLVALVSLQITPAMATSTEPAQAQEGEVQAKPDDVTPPDNLSADYNMTVKNISDSVTIILKYKSATCMHDRGPDSLTLAPGDSGGFTLVDDDGGIGCHGGYKEVYWELDNSTGGYLDNVRFKHQKFGGDWRTQLTSNRGSMQAWCGKGQVPCSDLGNPGIPGDPDPITMEVFSSSPSVNTPRILSPGPDSPAVTHTNYVIQGTGAPGATVDVSLEHGWREIATLTVDPSGNWSTTGPASGTGDYLLTVTQSLNGVPAGQAEKTITVVPGPDDEPGAPHK